MYVLMAILVALMWERRNEKEFLSYRNASTVILNEMRRIKTMSDIDKNRNSYVTIFDRRRVSADGTTLYYICFYLQSHRFHTKHVLIYSCTKEKKGKDNKVGTKCNTIYKVRKDQTSRTQHAPNLERYKLVVQNYLNEWRVLQADVPRRIVLYKLWNDVIFHYSWTSLKHKNFRPKWNTLVQI